MLLATGDDPKPVELEVTIVQFGEKITFGDQFARACIGRLDIAVEGCRQHPPHFPLNDRFRGHAVLCRQEQARGKSTGQCQGRKLPAERPGTDEPAKPGRETYKKDRQYPA